MTLIRSSCRAVSLIALIGLLLADSPAIPHQPSVPSAPATAAPAGRIPAALLPQMNTDLAANDPAYAITALADAPTTLRAADASQKTTATFTSAGVAIAGRGGASWHLHLAAYDAGALTAPVVETTPIADGVRATYRRGDLTEWYVNGPVGIEQGFTLATPPATGDTVALVQDVMGAQPTLADDTVLLTLPDGETQRYDGLAATDARGQRLPARLTVIDDTIRITVATAGAVWPVTVDPFVQTNAFTANDAATGDLLGIPVAVDAAGDVVVATASQHKAGGQVIGEVYIWHIGSPSTVFQISGLFPNQSGFGRGIAVSGDGKKVAIGVPNSLSDWPHEGNVLVYGYSAPVYTLITTLTPDSCTCQTQLTNAFFGSSVAMNQDGSIIAVGAPGESVVIQSTTFSNVGAVYLEYGPGYSSERLYIGDLPGGATDQGGEGFGTSVALDSTGVTLVVGEPFYSVSAGPGGGAIDVFNTSGTGSLLALLTARDAGTDDQLGDVVAVSADGKVIVGGAPYQIDSFMNQGAAYVFSGANFGTQKKLLATSPAANDYFGYGVAVNGTGNTVAVGTFNKNKVFVFGDLGYGLSQTITGTMPLSLAFGKAVALSADGSTLVVGAPGESDGAISRAGIVHILTQQVPKPLPSPHPTSPTQPGPVTPSASKHPTAPPKANTPNAQPMRH